jgi:hypothetical protein
MSNAGEPKTILGTVQNAVSNVVEAVIPSPDKVGKWDEQLEKAKKNLSEIGKPTVTEVSKLASIRYQGKDNSAFLDAYKTLKTPTKDIPLTPVEPVAPVEPVEPVAPVTTVATKRTSRKKKKIVIVNEPTDPVEQMRLLYKLRAKKPLRYMYTPEGELIDKDGEYPSARLRPFSGLTPEERHELENQRETDLKSAEETYETALIELRSALDLFEGDPDGPVLSVVRANEKVREASLLRSSLAYPLKWTTIAENPEIRDVLLSEIYESRKMGYDVFLLKRRDMIQENYLGRYREVGEVLEQQGGSLNSQLQKVLFITEPEDPETGIFHPAFIAEFNFNGTRYSSIYQAYEGERFKELNNEILRKQILGTRSARTIHTLVEKEPIQPKDPRGLWQDILEAFYLQQKDAAQRLLNTGSAKFHLMDKQFGNQLFIETLEGVRTFLRENEGDGSTPLSITESVITEDEQKKARTGAVINNFRRRA